MFMSFLSQFNLMSNLIHRKKLTMLKMSAKIYQNLMTNLMYDKI